MLNVLEVKILNRPYLCVYKPNNFLSCKIFVLFLMLMG